MQTLKTAIVVLLMMTVMYGCYVSLTNTPEPLPAQVADLIDESGDFTGFAIDSGVPDSLSGVADDGEPSGGPAELSFSDGGDRSSQGDSAAGAMASFTDREPAGRKLPKPEEVSPVVAPDFGQDYPSTQATAYGTPDPESLDSLSPSGWSPEELAEQTDGSKTRDRAMTDSESATDESLDDGPNVGLANAIKSADRQYAANQPAEALATLSLFYNTPGLSESQRQEMLNRLDPLAATVIYSRKHLLEQPHRVGQSETLMEIASRYELPWQLLANINAIEDPVTVLPGTELKVIRGPFRAEVDLARDELTIFLGDLYAGRFEIRVGEMPSPEEGSYIVKDKQTSHTFYDRDGSPIPPDDPRNPYGNLWLDLGSQLCIHGSQDRTQPTDLGCISLRGADADDLFGILSQGSSVTIRR